MPSVTPKDINMIKPRTPIMEVPQVKVSIKKQKFINRVLLIIVLIAISLGGYFYYKLYTLQKNVLSSTTKEAQDLLGKVANLYLIPTGEEPVIATVSDPSALKDQVFFTGSQKGDKVLIFSKAGKAVLYRPSINKIIETAPINNSTNDKNTKPPETTTSPAKDKTF